MTKSRKVNQISAGIIAIFLAILNPAQLFAANQNLAFKTIVPNPNNSYGGRKIYYNMDNTLVSQTFSAVYPNAGSYFDPFLIVIPVSPGDYVEVTFIGNVQANCNAMIIQPAGFSCMTANTALFGYGGSPGTIPVWRPFIIKNIYRCDWAGPGSASFLLRFYTTDSYWYIQNNKYLSWQQLSAFAEVIDTPVNSPP